MAKTYYTLVEADNVIVDIEGVGVTSLSFKSLAKYEKGIGKGDTTQNLNSNLLKL